MGDLGSEYAAEPMHTELVPVLYVLDDEGEANGTVRFYCSHWCREKAIQVNEDPIAEGEQGAAEVLDGTLCQYCEQPVL